MRDAGARPEPGGLLARAALLLALASAAACGVMHSPLGDGDAEGERDAERPDADADADADRDDRPDADEGDREDADPEADEDRDFDPGDRSWLLRAEEAYPGSGIRAVEPFPGGGLVVAGSYAGRAWLARLDAQGDALWSRTIGGGSFSVLSVGDDGRIHLAANAWFAAFDQDGDVLWQRWSHDVNGSAIRGLPDGSVVVFGGRRVMRYSPEHGVLWGGTLVADFHGIGQGMAQSEEGRLFLVVGGLLVAMDLDGGLLWARRLAPISYVLTGAVAATPDGGLVLTGAGLWTVRLDRDGRVEWALRAGRYEPGSPLTDSCYPRCDVDQATGLAVSAAGEVMVVGYSISANDAIGLDPYTSLFALWLGPAGEATFALAMAERRPTWHSDGLAAAWLPSGEWVVGGVFSEERAVLASLDAARSVGGSCELVAETSFPPEPLDVTLEPVEVTLEAGDFEVTDADPLTFEDLPAPMERLCF